MQTTGNRLFQIQANNFRFQTSRGSSLTGYWRHHSKLERAGVKTVSFTLGLGQV
jgi:hypothetical protein